MIERYRQQKGDAVQTSGSGIEFYSENTRSEYRNADHSMNNADYMGYPHLSADVLYDAGGSTLTPTGDASFDIPSNAYKETTNIVPTTINPQNRTHSTLVNLNTPGLYDDGISSLTPTDVAFDVPTKPRSQTTVSHSMSPSLDRPTTFTAPRKQCSAV